MNTAETFEMHWRDATQRTPYLSMLEGMWECREDDNDPATAGYGELNRLLLAGVWPSNPADGAHVVTLPRWFHPEDERVLIDIQGIAQDVLANCIDNSSGYKPHQADREDPDYDPEAEDLIFEGDVRIESAATSSLPLEVQGTLETLLEYCHLAHGDGDEAPEWLQHAETVAAAWGAGRGIAI